MTESEYLQDDPSAPDRPRRSRRRVIVIGVAATVVLVGTAGVVVAANSSSPRQSAVLVDPVTTASSSASSTTPTPAPISSSKARANARPTPTRAHVTQHTQARHTTAAATTAPAQGGQQSYPVGRQSSVPVPVAAPPVIHTTAPSRPAPTTPAPKPHPTPTPTPYQAHFVSVGMPAAFAGIPRGGVAQSAAESCARNGSCNVTGLQWGGSCSMPPYRGDTAGVQHSGWAMWQRGPDDCTWAMAVSSF